MPASDCGGVRGFVTFIGREAAASKMGAVFASILMVLSAGIALALGVLHLVYTFSGNKLTPRDSSLQARMAQVSPVITRQTTMWKAWVGFNATHSCGLILFGLVYGYLAVVDREILFNSPFLLAIGLAMLGGAFYCQSLFFQQALQERTNRNNQLCA